MNWEVEFTAEFGKWYSDLEEATLDRIIAAVQVLGDRGPGLGRPLVDSVKGSADGLPCYWQVATSRTGGESGTKLRFQRPTACTRSI